MKKIEEKNMALSQCLRKTSLISLFVLLVSCSAKSNLDDTNGKRFSGLLSNFIQANEKSFTITSPYQIEKIDSISINHKEDFLVASVTSNKKGSTILISRKTDKLLQELTISFYDSNNTLRKIHVYFYSQVINIHQINRGSEFIFNKATTVVPPLFIMYSLQVGDFKICMNRDIIYKFNMLHELYLFSLRAKPGDYHIGEGDCENPLFKIVIL